MKIEAQSESSQVLAIPPPPTNSLKIVFFKGLFHIIATLLVFPISIYYLIFRGADFLDIINKATGKPPIQKSASHKDPKCLERILASPVAQAYIQGGLEYQLREGYCASATIRCILKSIPRFPHSNIPEMKAGGTVLARAKAMIDNATADTGLLKTSILYGEEGYEAFQNVLKKSNDIRYRIAVNFLRSPLNGLSLISRFIPARFLLTIFGGHFSVIIGYLEQEDLVAVFDVNHTYNGVYFVESRRLFDAVNTADLSVRNNRITRGLVIVEIV